ncbi:MAG: PorT family protein [Bacteroidales bacterium]|nr:PorT family protein [Bacteroidales bacterium]
MKKITLSIVTLLMTLGLSAQTHFGIKGGLNFNNTKDITFEKNSVSWNSTGWHAGILIQAKMPLGFAFQPELLYSVKKYGFRDHKFNLSYVELPLNFQWGIDLLILRPFVFAAPYVSYLASKGGEANEWKGVKNIDYGCGAGFGLDLWKLQVMFKWNWAFGTLGNMDKNEISFNKSNLNGFHVSLGILF